MKDFKARRGSTLFGAATQKIEARNLTSCDDHPAANPRAKHANGAIYLCGWSALLGGRQRAFPFIREDVTPRCFPCSKETGDYLGFFLFQNFRCWVHFSTSYMRKQSARQKMKCEGLWQPSALTDGALPQTSSSRPSLIPTGSL